MDKIKFFTFDGKSEDEIQEVFDAWTDNIKPVIKSIKQTNSVHPNFSNRYIYFTVVYTVDDAVFNLK